MKKAMMMVLVLAVVLTAIAMPAASADNAYVGTWVLDEQDDDSMRVEVFADGTLCVVYPDEQNVGYFFSYVIGEDGDLIAYDSDNAFVLAFGMMNYYQVIDADGDVWNRD